jgi:mannose-6-phosphate isomerase-like protein (cupin superfamily)
MAMIKTIKFVLVVLLGYFAGNLLSAGSTVAAQHEPPEFKSTIPAPQLRQPIPMWPNQPKDAMYWSIDDIRKAHETLAAAESAGRSVDPNATLHDFPYWTRTHSYFIVHVPKKGRPAAAQQHAGYSQFIVVMGGSGHVIAGGQLVRPSVLIDKGQPIVGEIRGTAVQGGETFTLKAGDWVSIPANSPAQFTAESDGGLTYMVMKINAMLYPWDLIR